MRRALACAAAALLAVPLSAATADAAAPPLPTHDSFYRYDGASPLRDIKPGTVLKERAITVALGTQQTPVPAEQLLYRTSGELRQPTVTVTTVLLPATLSVAPRILGYLSFYDALGSQCDPSYTLRGGDPGAANQQQTDAEEALILQYLADGYVVTVPDFEGEKLEWTAGHEAGYGALDALTATERYLKAPPSTPVAMSGYSGGSIAADWAAELAPSYAPNLDIVGVAAGGIPVDYAHNLTYINGSPSWSGILPATLVALARAYRLDLAPYLSDYGKKLTAQVQSACIGSFQGAYPHLRIQQLLKPQYRDVLEQRAFVRIINNLIMGTVPGHPRGPLFLGVGDADGTGDGVMVAADVEALAHEYCAQGVPVQLAVYTGQDHTNAALRFEPAAAQFLAERFAGLPFHNGCATVPRGDSIKPLPVPAAGPAAPGQHRVHHRVRPSTPATAANRLAATGGTPVTPIAGAALLLAALGVGVLARRTHSATSRR